MFSCRSAGFFHLGRLPPEIDSELRNGPRLHLAPIRRILELHPPALVVVADKERLRLFISVLTEIHQVAEDEGAPVDRHRQGGWSAIARQRREDVRVHSNLAMTGELLSHVDQEFFRRIYLAGPPQARGELHVADLPGGG